MYVEYKTHTLLWQIYSRHRAPNSMRIGQVL